MMIKRQDLGRITDDTLGVLIKAGKFCRGDRFTRPLESDTPQIVYAFGEKYVKVFLTPDKEKPKKIETKWYSLDGQIGRDSYEKGTKTYNALLTQFQEVTA